MTLVNKRGVTDRMTFRVCLTLFLDMFQSKCKPCGMRFQLLAPHRSACCFLMLIIEFRLLAQCPSKHTILPYKPSSHAMLETKVPLFVPLKISFWMTVSSCVSFSLSVSLPVSPSFSLKLECDKLASEKSEMQRHYIMVSKCLCVCIKDKINL